MPSSEETKLNATPRIVDEPVHRIESFNQAYKAWMTSLQKQLPNLHHEFDVILDRLYVADAQDPSYPMHIFQWYTGPYVKMMLAQDPQFFDCIARDSEGKSMPVAFKPQFLAFDRVHQERVWKTLQYLMRLTAQVYYETYSLV